MEAAWRLRGMSTRTLHPAFIVTKLLKQRFVAKTVKGSSGCHEWTRAINPNGYGKVKISGRSMDAHVASWRISNGGQPVPVGSLIMHSCDNRKCVNPDHLSCGTSSLNMIDCREKGRLAFPIGEQVKHAILTEDLVAYIRRVYVPYKHSFMMISKELGVSESCVWAAYHGYSWKHVTKSEVEAAR
jgi:hypothetical protein